MLAFRLALATIFISIAAYTSVVVANHGPGLLPIFFGDIATMGWPGQFNLDFLCFLIMSATWLSWRHNFTPTAFALGLAGLLGGAFFLSAYLLFMSFKVDGDLTQLLSGKPRAH